MSVVITAIERALTIDCPLQCGCKKAVLCNSVEYPTHPEDNYYQVYCPDCASIYYIQGTP